MRKTALTLATAVSLIAMAAAQMPSSQLSAEVSKGTSQHVFHQPQSVTGNPMKDCMKAPVDCGLVVW